MRFADVVDTSAALAATRSRTAKVAAIAALLRTAEPNEVEPAAAFLTGAPRNGRTGVGWSTLSRLDAAPAAEPSLSVADVEQTIDAVRVLGGTGSARQRTELLRTLFTSATAAEQAYLAGLFGGEVRHGAQEGVLLAAVAAAAGVDEDLVRRAFMLSGRLPETAALALRGGGAALAEVTLAVGRGVRPMLATPAESLDDALAELGPATVEYKLDGARIQIHRSGSDVRVYTRTLREITESVPELVELTAALPCRTVVLDGETLALTDSGRPRPFQETMSRFGARDPRELLLRPYFFDCLHLDGVDLLDAPLADRLAALDRVAGPHRIPGLLAPTPAAAHTLFADALADGHEGLLVKSLAAPYSAGRRGRSWQKVKPAHTLDLVVLAADWGHGRRTGLLSNLHLGARDPDGGPPVMVGKTFKGLTDALLGWQTEEFPRHETRRDDYTVHLRPELVVEIELDGVQVSQRYPGGVALRFARVLRYRPDKDAAEADTLDAVRALLPRSG